MDHLTRVRQDLERLVEETRKAACYVTVARAWILVPSYGKKWSNSECQTAMHYVHKGTHMAFAVTLAALLEEGKKGDRVSLPRIMNDLRTASLRRAIADDLNVSLEQV